MVARMKTLFFILVAAAFSGHAHAEELNARQQRMKACNTQADQKSLKAGERNHFMKACLKGAGGNARQLTPHQQRSQECSRQARAKRLEGSERRGFMSECEKPRVKQDIAADQKMKSCEERAKKRRLDSDEVRKYVRGCTKGSAAGAT
jgi:hypothetical protein